MKRKIFNPTDFSGSSSSGDNEMVVQLKEKFHITGRKGEVVQILMVLPNSWSVRKIEHEFRASD
jgi:hypothetical protein